MAAIAEMEQDWKDLSEEFRAFQTVHREYLKKLDELADLDSKCTKELSHQRYRLSKIKSQLKRIPHAAERASNLQRDIQKQELSLTDMEQTLPRESGRYLKVILGGVNVSILTKEGKFRYKDEYEKFKLTITALVTTLAVFNYFNNVRVMDLIMMFALVWYYCTLTIREGILSVNGSRIKGWWTAHHFLATVMSGLFLIWPDGVSFQEFRSQFMVFNCYLGFVQYLQFVYQRGCLYRLKALGDRHSMDITIEGFHSWMWHGLSFLLPFLYVGYGFQFFNSWRLWRLSGSQGAPWQVTALSLLFLVIGVGNTITTSMVLMNKISGGTESLKLQLHTFAKRVLSSKAVKDQEKIKDKVKDK